MKKKYKKQEAAKEEDRKQKSDKKKKKKKKVFILLTGGMTVHVMVIGSAWFNISWEYLAAKEVFCAWVQNYEMNILSSQNKPESEDKWSLDDGNSTVNKSQLIEFI